MNMMISYQELVRTFPNPACVRSTIISLSILSNCPQYIMESPISALVLVIFNIWSLADGTTLIVFPSIDLLFLSVI